METKTISVVISKASRKVPPSGGSLEIGNFIFRESQYYSLAVPPSGGSLEIGNLIMTQLTNRKLRRVPPSGGSLEIGN